MIAEQFPVEFVFSDHRDAYVLERAKNLGVASYAFELKEFDNKEAYEEAIVKLLDEHQIDLVCLAGYMKIVGPTLLAAYEGRIINIHPSLIPSFCGVGYYGLHVHEKALERGVKVTGATVHFVNEGMDEGPIIAQKAVAVEDDDTPEILQRRVMEQAEWLLLPQAVDDIANGRICVVDGKVKHNK